ncbi:MAG: signal peptidase II [Planctomyces sp.]|nr:signal peptidase II [Planctomyces sp.]
MQRFLTSRWNGALWLCVVILVVDQWTKLWAVETLDGEQVWQYFGDTFRMQYALNPGGFLGLGGNLSSEWRKALFIGLNGVGLLALAILPCIKRLTLSTFFACWLIFAGGIGNQIDRIRLGGYVIDFLNIGWGPVRSGIFNVADMAITLGAILLFVTAIRTPAIAKVSESDPTSATSVPGGTQPKSLS